MIGDQPCRFKYRQVQVRLTQPMSCCQPENPRNNQVVVVIRSNFHFKEDGFGLSAQEILLAEDRELDEFVNMKKLAPYRTAPIKV